MSKIADLLSEGQTFSFEFFPPKSQEGVDNLKQTIKELEPLNPAFVSVTYGAGGSTRDLTHDLVVGMKDDSSLTAMAHLTCAGHSAEQLDEIARRYARHGIENILALRGDPRAGETEIEGDLNYAVDLVNLVRDAGDFSIGVAAHPDGHPLSSDLNADRSNLARKLEVADFAVTQFFFYAHEYASLVESLADLGIKKPVLPGIMPVQSISAVARMAQLAGTQVPTEIASRFEPYADDPESVRKLGVEIATELCQDLLALGVPGLHFFTLNRSISTREIYANLGL